MTFEFEYTLDERDIVIRYDHPRGADYLDLISVTENGKEIPLTSDEEREILDACWSDSIEQWIDYDADEADYRYDLQRERDLFDD